MVSVIESIAENFPLFILVPYSRLSSSALSYVAFIEMKQSDLCPNSWLLFERKYAVNDISQTTF